MKKVMIGLLVMLAFQLCTSELNEIDGVIENHIDSNYIRRGDINHLPSNSFLVEYFKNDNYETSISTRTERRISHDFNSPISNLQGEELSAKWTGNFYFGSGDYVFSVKSDKGIKVLIDDRVVLNDLDNTIETTYNVDQQLDGVHKVEVEYNIENSNTEKNNNTSTTNGSSTNNTTNNTESTTTSNSSNNDTSTTDGSNSNDSVNSGNTTNTEVSSEPVVEVDNNTPTVEVGWEPVSKNAISFFEGFENGISKPPWKILGKGIVETVSSPKVSGSKACRLYIKTKKYSNNTDTRAQIEYVPANGADIPRYFDWFTSHGFRFAMYVPKDYKKDPVQELVWQLHQWASSEIFKYNPPMFYFVIENGVLRISVRYATEKNESSMVAKHYQNMLTLKPGRWHYFVIDTHWDYRQNGNGYHKVYAKIDSPPTKNDVILNYKGPTGYNDVLTGYPTFSIYKSKWKYQSYVDQSVAAGITHREYFFDDIEISNKPYFGK